MNISFLIPSRFRVERLKESMLAALACVEDKSNVEFVLRLHSDDTETISKIQNLLSIGNVKIIIGPPLGYSGDPVYFWEMSQLATGKWLYGLNDDVLIYCDRLDKALELYPESGVVIIPETHKLNHSGYHNDGACPFKILPNNWWKSFGITHFCGPTDKYIETVLMDVAKWQAVFLKGLTAHHIRTKDKLMKEEGR